ncbi:RNA polymerase sigma-70 factor, ECF subfamily [Filimonas lacunae]|uniref:RNA polymerase sigma factor SigS n=1 Tax=Filimonas lacunae TaxID=477680 RepID=A0A173MA25_9BACT|nr:sigma-70 family RNA polymerase sigma factor [Filimonas lacunae]BAV04360.1 RNA polymerase ECF-type sigma factor [Filimonas lacunae]SIT31136.1 RNA polymerase sigma-70 factor, ECF subfamily [Filimonas lacunae]
MEIVEAVKNGDPNAFSMVFEQFHEKVFGFFMNRMQGNREEAKELTQLTYIKLWQSRHTLSLSYTIDRQLFVMAKHTLVDYIRREARAEKSKDVVAATYTPQQAVTEFSNSFFEGKDYVIARLKQLPPTRKKILQLKMLNGYSNKEIAGLLSISVKTVEDHVTKGLHELRATTTLSVPFLLFFLLDSMP